MAESLAAVVEIWLMLRASITLAANQAMRFAWSERIYRAQLTINSQLRSLSAQIQIQRAGNGICAFVADCGPGTP